MIYTRGREKERESLTLETESDLYEGEREIERESDMRERVIFTRGRKNRERLTLEGNREQERDLYKGERDIRRGRE